MGALEAILISFLWALFYIALILMVAWAIVWVAKFFNFAIDPNVFYWGRVAVILLCVIVIVGWLFGVINILMGGATFHFPAPYRAR